MSFIDTHVRAVQKIMRDSLDHCEETEVRELFEAIIDERGSKACDTSELPWLMLPICVCEALKGNVEAAQFVAAGLEFWRIAAGCLDAWQDRDTTDALWQRIGAEQAVNLAVGLIPLSPLILTRLADFGISTAIALKVQAAFQRTLLRMCEGQHIDLLDDLSLDDYQMVAGKKTGSLLRLGCHAGALIAGATHDLAKLYGDFGYHLGIVDQVWNDLRGLTGQDGKSDANHRRTLPILATLALAQERYRPGSLEAQAGELYALAQWEMHHRRATNILDQCPASGHLHLFLERYSLEEALNHAN